MVTKQVAVAMLSCLVYLDLSILFESIAGLTPQMERTKR